MTKFEIERLSDMASGLDTGKRVLIWKALDTIENQEREIDALMLIVGKQAGLHERIVQLALELDQVKAERDALKAGGSHENSSGNDQ